MSSVNRKSCRSSLCVRPNNDGSEPRVSETVPTTQRRNMTYLAEGVKALGNVTTFAVTRCLRRNAYRPTDECAVGSVRRRCKRAKVHGTRAREMTAADQSVWVARSSCVVVVVGSFVVVVAAVAFSRKTREIAARITRDNTDVGKIFRSNGRAISVAYLARAVTAIFRSLFAQ